MLKKWSKQCKNERGLTLVELLAVVVILGILAAIAVPSIGGLIDNSKKDAHVANARQMISSAKLAVASESENLIPSKDGTIYMTLKDLEEMGYLEEVDDPDNKGYEKGEVRTDKGAPLTGGISYVKITKDKVEFSYSVYLTNGERSVSEGEGNPVLESDLSRSKVKE